MKTKLIVIFFVFFTFTALTSRASQGPTCSETDRTCREFETLANKEQFAQLIGRVDSTQRYSEGARYYIAMSYLALASQDGISDEQQETFCRKAIEFGQSQGNMCLYFIYQQKNREAAFEFLREYIATQPIDPVPYVILGEAELDRKNYKLADAYLRQSRKVTHFESSSVSWMLFQANYMLGDYRFASEMLENALNNGRFDSELKALTSDPRFTGIENRPEFKRILAEANKPESGGLKKTP